MPKSRNSENVGLPAHWRYRYGSYYMQIPPRLRHRFDGKIEQRLGKTYEEALAFLEDRLASDNEELDNLSRLTEDSITIGQIPAGPAVYFLLRDSKIVYVGQSMTPFARVTNHPDKDFDSVFFLPVPPEYLTIVEARYIAKFLPEMNNCALSNRITRELQGEASS